MLSYPRFRLAVLLLALVCCPGCLFRSHRVPKLTTAANIQSATQEQLIARINQDGEKIQTLNATVDIAAATGGSQKGKITEYQEIRGYILVRRPAMLRMIGLFPVVRNKAFDMVSDGHDFKLSIPAQNKFIIGSNELSKPSPKAFENLRPQHIYDALLLRPVGPQNELAVVENGSEVVTDPKSKRQLQIPQYIVDVIHHGERGWYLSRKVFFSRVDLQPHRQLIYDRNGYVASDVHYEDFREVEGVSFAHEISIWRPQEEYSVTLDLVTLRLNQPLKDEQFALAQPAGAVVVNLDDPATASDGKPK